MNESTVSVSGPARCSSSYTSEFNYFLGAYLCILHTAVEHKGSCGFRDLLLLLAAFSLMLPLSRSFRPIVLSRASFTSLKDTARDANVIYVFHKVFCIFCTSKKTKRLLSRVADWHVAGAVHGMETPADLQRCEQRSLLTQTLIRLLLAWALADQRMSHIL